MYRTVRGKRTRGSTNKLTRKISTFGIMGGLVPQRGLPAPLSRHINTKSIGQIVIPAKPIDGLFYMEGNNPMNKYLLSKNPVGSGGVGNMIPNIPCCSTGTVDKLRPKPANLTDVDNSNVGITPIPPPETISECDQEYGNNLKFIYDGSDFVGNNELNPSTGPKEVCLTYIPVIQAWLAVDVQFGNGLMTIEIFQDGSKLHMIITDETDDYYSFVSIDDADLSNPACISWESDNEGTDMAVSPGMPIPSITVTYSNCVPLTPP